MSKFSGSIDLKKLPGAEFWKMQNGKNYICIPTDENPSIIVGSKGIYLGLFVAETAKSNYGNSHLITPSIANKDDRAGLSEEKRRELCPILGNLRPIQKEETSMAAVSLDGTPAPVAIGESNDSTESELVKKALSQGKDDLPW